MEKQIKTPNYEITEESTFMHRCDEAREKAYQDMQRRYEVRNLLIDY